MSAIARIRSRRALSIVEFLGCLVAVGGGIVIGAMYHGVDVKDCAVSALQYSQIAPAPAATAVAPGTADSPAVAPNVGQTPVTLQEAISLTAEEREQLTQKYWESLNSVMQAEADHRAANPEDGALLHDYLAHRHAGHRQAADDIAQLNRHGVDGHVAAYAIRVQAWHEEGAAMFAHAKNLVTDAPSAQLSGPFAHEWQSASTQHQMEERLLSEKHAAVQSYLEHADRSADN
jgi:hypothetical protein